MRDICECLHTGLLGVYECEAYIKVGKEKIVFLFMYSCDKSGADEPHFKLMIAK